MLVVKLFDDKYVGIRIIQQMHTCRHASLCPLEVFDSQALVVVLL